MAENMKPDGVGSMSYAGYRSDTTGADDINHEEDASVNTDSVDNCKSENGDGDEEIDIKDFDLLAMTKSEGPCKPNACRIKNEPDFTQNVNDSGEVIDNTDGGPLAMMDSESPYDINVGEIKNESDFDPINDDRIDHDSTASPKAQSSEDSRSIQTKSNSEQNGGDRSIAKINSNKCYSDEIVKRNRYVHAFLIAYVSKIPVLLSCWAGHGSLYYIVCSFQNYFLTIMHAFD
jgi:hypothetical protein